MKLSNKLVIGSSIALFAGQLVGKWLMKQNNHKHIQYNTETSFNINKDFPTADASAYIHSNSSLIGQVQIGKEVFIAPFASIRGDEGLKIHIGDYSNIQDAVILHGLKNFEFGTNLVQNTVFVNDEPYSIYIGDRVTLAHQCQIHGPVRIDSKVFVGMQGFVFNSYIQEGVVLEPGCKVIDVMIPKNRYVSAGMVISKQQEADELPEITPDYKYFGLNEQVVKVNEELVHGYRRQ